MTRRTRGWSTVELICSVTVLVFGLLTLAAGFHGSAVLAQEARQNHALKQAYRSMIADLEATDVRALLAEFGAGSGKENFWCGDDNSDAMAEQKLYYSPPLKAVLSGNVKFYTDERAPPPSWTSFSGGLDLNGDGLLSDLLGGIVNPLLGLLGLGGGGGGGGGAVTSEYLALPTEITFTMNSSDGPRTFQAGLILSR